MKCKEVRKRLVDYASGDLKPEAHNIIREHLKLCGECSFLLEEMNSIMELTNEHKRLEPHPFLYTRIREKLAHQGVQESPIILPAFKGILQPLLIILVMAGALFTGVKIGNTVSKESEQPMSYFQETEYYLNDMQQESLEIFLMSDVNNGKQD
ncbi:MAG: zf-HC2 domain-containing protein, partial [Bacteroidota bacterium]